MSSEDAYCSTVSKVIAEGERIRTVLPDVPRDSERRLEDLLSRVKTIEAELGAAIPRVKGSAAASYYTENALTGVELALHEGRRQAADTAVEYTQLMSENLMGKDGFCHK